MMWHGHDPLLGGQVVISTLCFSSVISCIACGSIQTQTKHSRPAAMIYLMAPHHLKGTIVETLGLLSDLPHHGIII